MTNTVLVYDKITNTHKEKTIFRKYSCYGATPKFDSTIKKSYMFCGKNTSLIPSQLTKYIKKFKDLDSRYNQFVVNYYNSSDYIEPHRDCDAHMVDNYKIGVISLGEIRPMIFTHIHTNKGFEKKLDSTIFEFSKDINQNFRHQVPTGKKKRISITARMMKL